MERVLLFLLLTCANAKSFCERAKMPLEVGQWHSHLKQMDSAVVDIHPVSISEGQVYVYENSFPGHTIKYIHVDNLAKKSCGAGASIKSGGVGTSSVLIVLQAESNQEIRSIIDIWGTKSWATTTRQPVPIRNAKNLKSWYLFKEMRTINHNAGN